MERKESVIRISQQMWKIWLGYVIGLVGGVIVVATAIYRGELPPATEVLLMLIGGLLVLGAQAFPCVAIKCPACGAKWYWIALTKKSMRWFWSQSECPECGSSCRNQV